MRVGQAHLDVFELSPPRKSRETTCLLYHFALLMSIITPSQNKGNYIKVLSEEVRTAVVAPSQIEGDYMTGP